MHKTNLKKSFTLLLPVLCLLAIAVRLKAQEAYKIDETSYLRCDLSEVPQITDSPMPIFKALNENKEAQSAIIVYGMEGFARRYAKDVKRWLVEVRGVDSERLVTLYGGSSAERRLELWLIPQGATLPKVNLVDDYNFAVQFDTYGYWHGEYCGSDRLPALAEFAEALKQRPGLQGYIVARPHRNKRKVSAGDAGWNPDGYVSRQQVLRRLAQDKSYLVRKFGLAPTRVKAIVGDNDEWTHSEIWLVPPGAKSPIPEAKNLKKER
jgi:hypothetical protein